MSTRFMTKPILDGKTAFITGASRGIGRAIALRLAKDGCNVAIASKTSDPHPKLAGTIHETAASVDAAGGKGLALQCDVRSEESVAAALSATVKRFGGIDIVVNNAGAIQLTPTDQTTVKRFDLMMQVNARAVFVVTSLALLHLEKSSHAHVVTLSPPIHTSAGGVETSWLKGITPYTLTKYGMTLLMKGFAEEFREKNIAVNSIWPRSIIDTAAVDMLMDGAGAQYSRSPEIMADAVHAIVTTTGLAVTGRELLDEVFLRERGVSDFSHYANKPGADLWPDLYVEGYGQGALRPLP
jgi:citronellol/citronellal dehydrogenase